MKKHIKVKFTDFWEGFVPEESLLYTILAERYDVELTDAPEYVFSSVFGREHLKYDCIKVSYTGENQSADFNLFDYAIGFDDIQFGDRYLRFPLYYFQCRECFETISNRELLNDLTDKPEFCSFVVSSSMASSDRAVFYEKLSEYKRVNSGGRLFNNVGGPVKDKIAFLKKHKFNIAFENCSQPGYSTEKLLQAFAARTIPIYWGDPNISETFNEDAFINCHKYTSWDAVVERVKNLDNDDGALLKMLNSPIFTSDNFSLEARTEALRQFLFHIFDQSLEEAYRYSRYAWGKVYISQEREREKAWSFRPTGLMGKIIYYSKLWKRRL